MSNHEVNDPGIRCYHGFAVRCDADGVVLEILFQEGQPRFSVFVGESLRSSIDPDSRIKFDNFLSAAKGSQPTTGWEMSLPYSDSLRSLIFAAITTRGGFVVAAASGALRLARLLDEFPASECISEEEAQSLGRAARGIRENAEAQESLFEDFAYLNSELSLLQRELSRKNAELERTISELRTAEREKSKLEGQLLQSQKMESVGRLAGGVAHDFNNILGVILGHTELALEQVDSSLPLRDDLEEVRKAAERAANLTRQLLAFARKQTAVPRVLDLNQTVDKMVTVLARLIGENVYLRWKPESSLWPVKMDPVQLDQILTNLCINARDAILEVGMITIETENVTVDGAEHHGTKPGDYVVLAVRDDGCGMDQETLLHLFEPFFTTKEAGKGTGLGLATVYGIVKQNKGFINVSSALGQGTTVKIYMPRQMNQAKKEIQGPPASPSHGQETILVVEDEAANLRLIKAMLKNQGYSVIAAGTPQEAIRVVQEHDGKINLLITDVVMPEMNGRTLASNLLSRCPHLKVLFMSGYTADVIANHGVIEAEVNFIQKPFSAKMLAEKIRETMEK